MASPGEVAMWGALGAFNLALAALVLSVRPRRTAHLVVAAWFAMNGLAEPVIALFGTGGLEAGDPVAVVGAFMVQQATLVPLLVLPFLLPHRRLPARRMRVLWGLAAALVVVTWLHGRYGDALFWLVPVAGVDAAHPANHPLVGPLTLLTSSVANLALPLGAALFLTDHLDGGTRTQRQQARYFLAAYVGFAAALAGHHLAQPAAVQRVLAGGTALQDLIAAEQMVLSGFAVALVLVGLAAARTRARLAAGSAGAASSTRAPRGAGADGAAGEATRPGAEDLFVVAFVAIGLALPWSGAPLALAFMLVRPALFTYGILQFQMLDVDLRRRAPLVAAAVLAGLAAVFTTLAEAGPAAGLPVVATLGLALFGTLAAGLVFAWPLVARLLGTAPGADARGRDIYRAALEHAVRAGEGHSSTDSEVLRALRGRLGIGEREHAVLEREVREACGLVPGGLAPGARFLGKYVVEAPLGEGGFGRAFLAQDEALGRRVVLKVARAGADGAERALREGRIVARLNHPRIVAIHDADEVAGEAVLVLEHLPRGSLADRLRAAAPQPLPAAEASALADDVLAALEAAHAEGLVHRDVKPANILLTDTGRAKLADFGIANPQPGSGTMTGVSFTAAHAGSVPYMAPEQARGKDAEPRSDLYSLGVVLYEMLAGQPYLALEGLSEFEARLVILEQAPTLPLPGLPLGLSEVLASALAKDPADRPVDAADMRRRLAQARRELASS